jgi:mannose-6-phosphate isomerase-like protein (cupin superfamily)
MLRKVALAEKLAGIHEHWSPKIAGELNGQHVKLVKVQGDFVWHHHETADELFLVLRGELTMHYREEGGPEQVLLIAPGEFVIVPRNMEHRPSAEHEVEILLFEPAGTLNTGNVTGPLTADPAALI